jgi:NitT/TauT family transport system ATP-binding protein
MLGLEFEGSRVLGRLFGAKRRAALDKARTLLEAIGLDSARDKYPSQLSGGMQQRLSIAQSVIREPKVLLLDEPFGALDPGITADMHEIVLRLWSLNRMTIFMITHDLKESFQLGTRVLVFDKPRIDPQSPEAYGATVTYNIPLRRRDAGDTGVRASLRPESLPAEGLPLPLQQAGLAAATAELPTV